MLPVFLHVPAGLVFLAVGLVACFAGYRLFRSVLTVYGFIVGALFAISFVAQGQTVWLIVALVFGGLVGAAIMHFGYFLGVMLVGAGLGAVLGQSLWIQFRGEPNTFVVLLMAAIGAVVAWWAQRYVIIIGTAFLGAYTAVGGALALFARGQQPPPSGTAWWSTHVALPSPADGWPFFAWVVLGVVGTFVQLGWAKKGRR